MANDLVIEKNETYMVWDNRKIKAGDVVVVDLALYPQKLSHLDSNKLKAIAKSISFKPHVYTNIGFVIDIRERGKCLIVAVPKPANKSTIDDRFSTFAFYAEKDLDKVEVIFRDPRTE